MIIPIRCFTCGNVLADKYRFYLAEVKRRKLETDPNSINRVIYLTQENSKMTIEGEVLNSMGIKDVCCRRHMLTHVDIE